MLEAEEMDVLGLVVLCWLLLLLLLLCVLSAIIDALELDVELDDNKHDMGIIPSADDIRQIVSLDDEDGDCAIW